jgi:hypothetical protein
MIFNGDAPYVGSCWVKGCSSSLTAYYYPGAKNFTTPIWNEIACYPLSNVNATINDTGDNGVAGITVLMSNDTIGTYTAYTGTNGNFTIAGVIPGTYNMTISKEGYVTMTDALYVPPGQIDDITMTIHRDT